MVTPQNVKSIPGTKKMGALVFHVLQTRLKKADTRSLAPVERWSSTYIPGRPKTLEGSTLLVSPCLEDTGGWFWLPHAAIRHLCLSVLRPDNLGQVLNILALVLLGFCLSPFLVEWRWTGLLSFALQLERLLGCQFHSGRHLAILPASHL